MAFHNKKCVKCSCCFKSEKFTSLSYKVECRLDKSKVDDLFERNKLYDCGDKKTFHEKSIFYYKSETGKAEEKSRKALVLQAKLQERETSEKDVESPIAGETEHS